MENRNTLFSIIFLLILNGCTTYPPPRIENGRYINPKYEFSISVPEGWEQTKKIPRWIKMSLSSYEQGTFKIMFSNIDDMGFIAVLSDKWSHNLMMTLFDKEAFQERMAKVLEKHKKKFLKKKTFDKITYKLDPLIGCSDSCQIYRMDAYNSDMKVRLVKKEFFHECDSDDTCDVIINLISKYETFEKNYKVFNSITESLEKINNYVDIKKPRE